VAQFLSESWFVEVEKIRGEFGDLGVPEQIKAILINVDILGHPEGDKQVHVAGGEFKRGHAEDAPTKLKVPYEVAKAIFVDGDQNAGMQAFMSGQIQIEGDMAVMMQLQMAGPPSDDAVKLQERVKAITEA
jgi:hypothetical protein